MTNNSSNYSPTQYNVQVGGANGTLTDVVPDATSGVPLISQGSSANPAFGTAVVAGGGTGATSLTGVLTGNGTSAITANAVNEGGVLLGGASNAVTDTGVLTKGTILVGDGSGAPTQLAVGSNDQVLTADSAQASGVKWAAVAAGGGAWTFISTATASASATIDFTGLTSTYFKYMVVIDNLAPATDGVILNMRTSTDNGSSFDSSAGNYEYAVKAFDGTNRDNATNSATEIRLMGGTNGELGNATNETASGIVYIYNPSAAKWTFTSSFFSYMDPSPDCSISSGAGVRKDTTAVDAIRFLLSSGNMSTGTFKLYGLSAS